MIRRAYDWTMRMAAHRKAPQALFWVSFAESSAFPVPPDAMLIPMVLADRSRAWYYASLATLASVLGGIVGYGIGYFLYETLGVWLINAYGLARQFEAYRAAYNEWGLWIILIKGLTPIPYKIVTIASGAAAFNVWVFVAASIVTRGARFFMVAALLYWFGEPIRELIERRLTLLTTAFVVMLVGGFVVIRYLI
ncbi:MAG TPA: YqaA family protein [Hyphomicrobiaceae bacterium]|jgi:membrane protein YqaA with SNARE-associated domain|nr:YqaA family protein [Hyphomicrobiaceae bacterium]